MLIQLFGAAMQTENGFSLVEIMISILLLMTGLLMMAHSMTVAIETNYRTKQETLAAGYAQQKIEGLKSVVFTHSDLTDGTHSDTPATGFSRSWSVSTDGTGNEKTVTLTMTRSLPDTTLPVRVTLVLVRSR